MREGIWSAFMLNWWELLIILLVLTPVFLGIAIYSRRQTREREEEQTGEATRRYRALLQKLKLEPAEERIVEILAFHLPDSSRKYLLLQNQRIFHQAATASIESGEVKEHDIAALRFKLGYSKPPRSLRPYSSAEIPEGSGVLVIRDIRPPDHGTVLEPTPDAFRVQLQDAEIRYGKESEITVVYQNSSGIFRFKTATIDHNAAALSLRHSENLDQVQRRRHYRRAIHLPVFVKAAYREERPATSHFVEIGGDGASIVNPDQRFRQGDDVELSFHPHSEATLHLVATVVRTSQGGGLIHVQFTRIRERTRDQVYNLLFAESRKDEENDDEA